MVLTNLQKEFIDKIKIAYESNSDTDFIDKIKREHIIGQIQGVEVTVTKYNIYDHINDDALGFKIWAFLKK